MSFPTSIENATYFQTAYDNLATALTQELAPSDSTAYVTSTTNWPSVGWLTVGEDIRSYTGKTSGTFTGLTDGIGGTTPGTHAVGAVVSLTLNATAWNRVVTELRATLTKLGVDSSAVTTSHDYKLSGVTSTAKALSTADDQTIASKKTYDEGCVIHAPKVYTPAAAATATLDLALGNNHEITMPAGNITIAISNETDGQYFTIDITQDGTGSRLVTFFTTIKWAGGSEPTLTTTADKRDSFGFKVTGADQYDGFIIGQNI